MDNAESPVNARSPVTTNTKTKTKTKTKAMAAATLNLSSESFSELKMHALLIN